MPTYIVLGHFTDQGIRGVRDSLKREDSFRKQCEKVGAQVKDIYRTMGRYDLVATIEAPDDVTVSSLVYSTGALGNIRTETLRAFSRRETEEAFELKAAYLGG